MTRTVYDPTLHATPAGARGEQMRLFYSVNKLLVDLDAAGIIDLVKQAEAPGDTSKIWLDLSSPEFENGIPRAWDGADWQVLDKAMFYRHISSDYGGFVTDAELTAALAAYQPLDADLTAWAAVSPSSYSTTAQIAAAYQPLDADLTSWAAVTRSGGFDAFATTPSSANLRSLLSDETGTGAAVFATSPTLVTPALGTPSALVLTNATGLPTAGMLDNAVTNAKLADMAVNTFKGRVTSGTGDPEDLTAAQARTILGAREVLTASRTYFVNASTGSDSNTGLSSGAAFATIQQAINVATALDLSIYSVTISVADGTYSTGGLLLRPYVGAGPIAIVGNTTTPANCVISPASGPCISSGAMFSSWEVRGFRLVPTSNHCISAGGAGTLTINNIRFDCATGNAAVRADFGAIVRGISGTFEMRNNCGFGFLSGFQAQINFDSATITYGSNVAYATANCYAQQMGVIIVQNVTYSVGAFSITGTRYNALANSLINTNGAGATFIPGSVAGATSGDGVYN